MITTAQKKIAIAGCGSITTSCHLPAALRSSKVIVQALVDANMQNALKLRSAFGLNCKTASRLVDVVGEVDAVVVATPNHAHFPVAQEALSHGLPVLVEKPITTRYADAVKLCEMAEEKGLVIAVGYKSRFYPAVILLRYLLEQRYMGRLKSFYYEFGSRGGSEPLSGYNIRRATAGGGALLNSATHFLDRMLYWFGEPKRVRYFDDNHGGLESTCKAEFEFDNDLGAFTGELFVSQAMKLRNIFVVETENYVCEIGDTQTDSVTLMPRSQPELRLEVFPHAGCIASPSKDYFQTQLEDFVEAICSGRRPRVDGRFGARSILLIEEIYRQRRELPEPWMLWREKVGTVHGK